MRFSVIVADPPWSYRVGGIQGDVNDQYSTMVVSDLAAIPVASWAAEECILACWGTWPKLDEGIDLIRAWGFDYVTGFPWVKTVPTATGIVLRRGIGFWAQQVSELLLIGRRGDPRRKAVSPVLGLLCGAMRQFYSPALGHSRKPANIQDRLEELFDGPYLELFARRERPGWSTWGLDTGFQLSATGVERVDTVRFGGKQLSLEVNS